MNSNFKFNRLPFSGTTVFTRISEMAKRFDALNIAQGFPDFDCSPRLLDILRSKVSSSSHQYAPMPGIMSLREKIAEKTEKLYQREYRPDNEITIVPGATMGIYSAISAFVQPGDKVIVFEPYYDMYVPAILLHGGLPVVVPLQGATADWNEFDRVFNLDVKAILINSPNNPSATVLGKEFLNMLARRIRNSNAVVISDEVYEHIIFDGRQHNSLASHPELWQRSLVISSFGKTYHATGWKMGYVLAPQELTNQLRKVYQYQAFSTNPFVQETLCEFMDFPEEYERLQTFYQEKRDFMLKGLTERTLLEPLPCHGTYFIVAKYNKISDLNDESFCSDMIRKKGIGLLPMSPFFAEGRITHHVRLCFAKKKETLEKALDILEKVNEV